MIFDKVVGIFDGDAGPFVDCGYELQDCYVSFTGLMSKKSSNDIPLLLDDQLGRLA